MSSLSSITAIAPPAPSAPDHPWLARALFWIAAIVGLRVVALWFNETDLFVDEAQYWFWGQNLDLGYFSKPPLIGWVLRAVTDLAQSSSPFWVRLPGPVLHGATALLLFLWIRRDESAEAGFWTALAYLSLPLVSVGSAWISTDTIMAPFFAAALLFYWRTLSERKAGLAVLAGVAIGLAFLAKYAAVYFFLGAACAAAFLPEFRPKPRLMLVLGLTFLAVASPNLIWNIANELTTLRHTADNIGWIAPNGAGPGLHFIEMVEFLGSQIGAFGPVFAVILVLAAVSRPMARERGYLLFAVPVLLVVTLQALFAKAYANWAAAAYLTATPLIVVWALRRHRFRMLRWGLVANAALCLLVPFVTIWPESLRKPDGAPAMYRYIGRYALSEDIFAAARDLGLDHVVASSRSILADLFYTGRDKGFRVSSTRGAGAPAHYYAQKHALEADPPGPFLFVTRKETLPCAGGELTPSVAFDTRGGAYYRSRVYGYSVPERCGDEIR